MVRRLADIRSGRCGFNFLYNQPTCCKGYDGTNLDALDKRVLYYYNSRRIMQGLALLERVSWDPLDIISVTDAGRNLRGAVGM